MRVVIKECPCFPFSREGSTFNNLSALLKDDCVHLFSPRESRHGMRRLSGGEGLPPPTSVVDDGCGQAMFLANQLQGYGFPVLFNLTVHHKLGEVSRFVASNVEEPFTILFIQNGCACFSFAVRGQGNKLIPHDVKHSA